MLNTSQISQRYKNGSKRTMFDFNMEFSFQAGKVLRSYKGGNSTVYCIKTESEGLLAVKKYEGDPNRILRMFERESSAIQYLNKNGIEFVPKFVAGSQNKNAICYKWLEGVNPNQSNITLREMFRALGELEELYLSEQSFDLAVDAVLDGNMILNQLKERLKEIKENPNVPHDFTIEFVKRLQLVQETNLASKVFSRKTYSFSDLGAHNIILLKNGTLCFIDLEFFGVDSYAKVFADLYVHPKTLFSSTDLYNEMRNLKQFQVNFEEEVLLLIPSIALKWSTISARREFLEPELVNQKADSRLFIDYFDFLVQQSALPGVLTLQEFRRMRE